MADPREELVPLVDAARARGDHAEVERLEAEVRRLNEELGKRKLTGVLDFEIPQLELNLPRAKVQRFSDWANPLRSQ